MADERPTERPYDLDRVVRAIIGVVVVAAIVWLMRFLSDVLIPFAIAVLLAYLINPIVSFLERKLHSRVAATLATVVGGMVVLAALIVLVVPIISGELSEFGRLAGDLKADAPALPDAKTLKARFDGYVDAQQNELYKRFLLSLKQAIVTSDYEALAVLAAKRIAPGVWGLVTGVLSFVLGLGVLIIILLFLVFVSIDYAVISRTWQTYLPPKYRDRITGFFDEFSTAMSQYFRGQFIIAVIVGVMFAVGFSLIGLRMGIVLGLAVGLLNMVPYLQTIAIVPALLLGIMRAVEHGSGVLWSCGLVLLVFVIVQAFQEAVLVPLIMGRQTGLRPIVLLLGVFIWGKLFGFLGLVLAIPLTCLGLAWYRRFVLGQQDARAIPEEPDG